MRCPYCGEDRDKVIDSRATDGGRAIRRRRHCLDCGKRFTTYEHIEQTAKLMVIERDGTRVPYNRQKILGGLEKACYKRPVTMTQMQQVAEDVEDQLFREHDREVDSAEIGKAVADQLKRLDHIAYVRFAAVFKQFRNVDDLLEEVKEALQNAEPQLPGQGTLFGP